MIDGPVDSVIGIDPGPSTGISFIDYIGDRIEGSMQVQVDGKSAVVLLEAVLARYYSDAGVFRVRAGQVEAFVHAASAGSKGEDAEVTRQLAFKLAELLQLWGYDVELRKKADICKKDGTGWASDKRLKAAGLLRPPENRHANDGSRHALYRAVHDLHKPDPLR
jgi:hypothetical protein